MPFPAPRPNLSTAPASARPRALQPCAAAPSLCSHHCQEFLSSFPTPLPAPKTAQGTEANRQSTHVQGLPTAAGVLSGDGTNSLPRSPVAGTSQMPAGPGSPTANFQGGGCLKTCGRLCLVGAEPARAAGKVTQEDTDVPGGWSPSRNPFGAAAL